MEFVTQERLNAARRALFAADSEGITVTDVAFAHGLYHLGRFSLQYLKTSSESVPRSRSDADHPTQTATAWQDTASGERYGPLEALLGG